MSKEVVKKIEHGSFNKTLINICRRFSSFDLIYFEAAMKNKLSENFSFMPKRSILIFQSSLVNFFFNFKGKNELGK